MSTAAAKKDLHRDISEYFRKKEKLEHAAPRGFRGFAKELFNDASLADIDILLDNDQDQKAGPSTKTFHGHRIVLATMSDYFRTMLYGQFLEADKREIRLKDVPYSMFERCMRFAYCGWDERLGELTLDEAEQFYGMVRMLLMESKVKELFCGWMKAKLGVWESELWRIVQFAFENDLGPLVESSIEYFANIANCGFKMDGFNEVSLAVVQKIIAKKVMCCSKVELHEAITGWVNANKDELSKHDEQKLFNDFATFPAVCYRGRRVDLYKHRETPKLKKVKVNAKNPIKEPPSTLLETPCEYKYSTKVNISKCLTLFGVTMMFTSNLDYGPKYGKVKTVLNIDFTITEDRYGQPELCSRKVRVDCDFTCQDKLSRNIFFQPIDICGETEIIVTLKWTQPGVQPKVCLFGSAHHGIVSTFNKSHVTDIFCRNVSDKCPKCPQESEYDSDSDSYPGCYW